MRGPRGSQGVSCQAGGGVWAKLGMDEQCSCACYIKTLGLGCDLLNLRSQNGKQPWLLSQYTVQECSAVLFGG